MAKHDGFNLLLIRSGPTAWDAEERLGSGADLPLSEAHAPEADDRLACLEGTELRTILSAPDQCSARFARSIAKLTGAKSKQVDDLRELDLGLWEGLRVDELEERYPKAFGQWLQDPWSVTPPDGESTGAAEDRVISSVVRSVEKLRLVDPGVCVVVRPLVYAILSRWATAGGGQTDGWARFDGPDWMQWATVGPEQLGVIRRATA